VAHRSGDAIGAGVAAADDDDIFAGRVNETAVLVPVQQALRVRREKITASNSFNSFSAG
jgi:hypothetical protein